MNMIVFSEPVNHVPPLPLNEPVDSALISPTNQLEPLSIVQVTPSVVISSNLVPIPISHDCEMDPPDRLYNLMVFLMIHILLVKVQVRTHCYIAPLSIDEDNPPKSNFIKVLTYLLENHNKL